MKSERDPWVRVKDESELREGMAVQFRPCIWCGKAETNILTGKQPALPLSVSPGGTMVLSNARWEWRATSCTGDTMTVANAIRAGRLFRLADDQLADDAEPATVVRGREMERAG